MSESLNIKAALGFMAALEHSDYKGLRAIITDDFVEKFPYSIPVAYEYPEVVRGGDAFVEFIRNSMGTDYKSIVRQEFVINHVFAAGDRVAVVWTLKMLTVEGVPYQNEYVYLLRITNGRVSEMNPYVDTLHAFNFFKKKKA